MSPMALLAEAQLPVVVASPHPQLAAARQGSAEVVAGTHLDDLCLFIWSQHGIVALREVLHFLELDCVSSIPPTKATEVTLTCAVQLALAGEYQRVLRPARYLNNLLAHLHEGPN
eukprot:CAMPEP_0170574062 /NCGR_PEP_ID=MMETSP0224-20130122/3098_1 /TAXON_ID=285029 /ORGANISM="Togula jolla, Strain CCCM 725" /LENGTH=114 /DNA_ID=CAMNT_0010896691 /DNA_START=601 /DNA_END=944 /DNA_ORIENTATION=-